MTSRSEAPLSRNPFGYHSRRWWVGLAAFLFLFLVGPFAEFGNIDRGTIHHAPQLAEHYQTMLLCFSLLLIYLVPFFLFVRYTRMRAGVPRWLVVLAFASGLFVPGWIAGELNAGADDLLRLLASKSFVSTWGDAIEAPLVEETLKLLTVVAVLSLVGRRDGRDWLVGGMCVGMGFQFSEDLGYIEDQIVAGHHGFETAVPVTLDDRISGALVSHWTYTALVAVPFLYAWGDITFDGGRRLSAARPKQHKRRKAQGAHAEHTAPGEKDASPAPQPPQGL